MATPRTTIVTMISASTGCPRASGNRSRDEHDDDERIREEVEELNDGRQTANGSRLIRAVLRKAPRRLDAAEAFRARHQCIWSPARKHSLARATISPSVG